MDLILNTIDNLENFDIDEFNNNPNKFIDKIEESIVNFKPADCPVTHRFTNGMYIREIFIPKGTILTSMEHKTEHPFVISMGHIAVISENEDKVIYCAPFTGITKPKTRRMLYAIEDTIWTTFHVTEKMDVEEIGSDILEKHSNSLLDKDDPRLNQWKKQTLNIQ